MTSRLLVMLALGGCGYFSPDTGSLSGRRCVDEDSNGDVAVSFTGDVTPLLQERCHACHLPGGANPVGVEVGGLDMTSYATLRAGGVVSREAIVVDGRPCESILYQKVGDAPPFGARMPRGGAPLAAQDLALLHDWIAEGAFEN
jgi:hypothetical protein